MGTCLMVLIIMGLIALLITYWPVLLIAVVILIVICNYCSKKKREKAEQEYKETALKYDSLDGHQFEGFCANVLSKTGFEYVSITPGSGDYGVDIIAFKNGKKYVFQCKHYSQKVNNKAVQEVYSGKSFYDADIAVVLTNNYFTQSAILTADKNKVLLWDRDKLNSLIRESGI